MALLDAGYDASGIDFQGGVELEGADVTAIVRELHVYGPEVPLREQNRSSAQHRGLGKALLHSAERIAREESNASELNVLSGVGAREYYRAEGYTTLGNYMVRKLGQTT